MTETNLTNTPHVLTAHNPWQYTHASILFISLPRKKVLRGTRSYYVKCSSFNFFYTLAACWEVSIVTLLYLFGRLLMGLISTTNIPEEAKTWDHVREEVKHNWTVLRYLAPVFCLCSQFAGKM